ncbi:hypothetical protein EZ449_15380 [Pedobacter frigidisoli]|uniref:Fibronectin type-III domain-containing protein n=1 Tax=Pedobacter frigidisoli TaxID=2530455 RepID=A0A4R0P0G6_9SPHI|nr:hypothetical protein [Pedobacter frigidisoli]TCD05845.1 hypothetical protein EZ449_15380 [Pedobacter frigidisoli]
MKVERLLLLMFVLSLFACSEFIEPSLKDRKIILLGPGEHLETNSYQQTFWWEGSSDAIFYRLQVATPSFDSLSKLVLDTLITSTKFTYTLDPGKYQWRVRAENGSSQTAFALRSFIVYTSSIAAQSVQLISPLNGLVTNKNELRYEWLNLYGATAYRLQVDNNNFLDESRLLLNISTDNLSYLQQLTIEGNFQYRMRAENAAENSKWSVVKNFNYDITPPEKAGLLLPANRQAVTLPVRLSWAALGDADHYQVYVYKSDSTSLYGTAFPQAVSSASYNLLNAQSGESLLWRIRAVDKAGNTGIFSNYYSFTVQ